MCKGPPKVQGQNLTHQCLIRTSTLTEMANVQARLSEGVLPHVGPLEIALKCKQASWLPSFSSQSGCLLVQEVHLLQGAVCFLALGMS